MEKGREGKGTRINYVNSVISQNIFFSIIIIMENIPEVAHFST